MPTFLPCKNGEKTVRKPVIRKVPSAGKNGKNDADALTGWFASRSSKSRLKPRLAPYF